MESDEDLLKLLQSSTKIERNKGVERLEGLLRECDPSRARSIEEAIVQLFGKTEVPWETKHGSLMGARTVINHPSYKPLLDDFETQVKGYAVRMLEDAEYRVRLAAGDLVGAFCKKNGCQIYIDIQTTLFDGITKNMDESGFIEPTDQCPQFPHNLTSNESHCTSAKEIFNDTAKWKHLETWLKCLQCIVEGCGPSFNSQINTELLDLLAKVLGNWSRFVREACGAVLGALISSNMSTDISLMIPKEESAVYRHAEAFSLQLAVLLSDEFSEVRMSASLAVRKLLLGLPDGLTRQSCLAILLPPLCFNRYYVAEGVRFFSQETWMQVTSGEGKRLVELNIDRVIAFDITQLKGNNHEIPETACTCIREMTSKVSPSIIEPFVIPLLTALRDCLASSIWTIRDAAFVTCGNIISSFPEQSRSLSSSFSAHFLKGLEDNAAPVREAAAIALGCTVKAYGTEALLSVITKIKVSLEGVEQEKTDEERRQTNIRGTDTSRLTAQATSDVAKDHSHGTGVCPAEHDHSLTSSPVESEVQIQSPKHQRPPELWELADGSLCLMCELAKQPASVTEVTKLLPLLAKAASFNHYSQHIFFLQSVCKQLPILFKNLGKRALKLYVELFFDVVFTAVASDKLPLSTAADECLTLLSELLGSSIFRARVESYNPRYLQYLEKTKPDSGHQAFTIFGENKI